MNTLILKDNTLITPETINFTELVKIGNTSVLNETFQSKMVMMLNQEFTDEEQRWYIANLYVYMHYHPTNDFPINLDHVFKMIGFANKGNAMKTIKSNFVVDEDYKVVIFRTEKNLLGGRPSEDIMLNIDTFKNLCMIAKTEKGKAIRKYYVKLENIYNKIIKEEIESKDNLIKEKDALLQDSFKQKKREVETTLKNSFHKRSLVYLIKITLNDEIIYKFGHTDDIVTRLRTHKNQIGEEIELVYCIESKDNKMLEKLLIDYLEQYKFRMQRVFNNKNQTELLKVNDIDIIKTKLVALNNDIENEKLLIMKLRNKIIDLENENIQLKQQLYVKDESQQIIELKNKIESLEKLLNYKLDETKINSIIENKDVVQDRIYKKRQVDKIDPTTLKILETYECINAIIINNPDFSYNQIYRCIKTNNVYKDFRWNYSGEKINPTNKITIDGTKITRVIQLDKNKNFVKIYSTKSELCKLLHIGLVKLNKYIDEEKILNDFYYVNESSYNEDISDNNYYEIHNSKQIRETNTETNEIIIYF
jgi:phage anti-repressor protein